MSWAPHPQARPDGSLRHLLTLDGLPRRHIEHLLRWSERYLDHLRAGTPAATAPGYDDAGRGPLFRARVVPMFLDAPDRDIAVRAAFALGADIGTFPLVDVTASMETGGRRASAQRVSADAASPRRLIDWLPDVADARYLILKHPQNGAPFLLSAHAAPHQQIINAGDGSYARPIVALCNVLEILRHPMRLTAQRVAILGDVAASGVARSLLHALTTLGTPEIRVVGQTTLTDIEIAHLGATWYGEAATGWSDVDVVIALPAADGEGHGGDRRLPVVRFVDATGAPGDASPVAPDMLLQAVWMAVFAVLAGCTDENVGRVVGTARADDIDASFRSIRPDDQDGQ